MISTIAVTTAANFITACQTNKKTFSTAKKVFQKISEGYEFGNSTYGFSEKAILGHLVIPTLSGFVVSTLPAIGLNIINGAFFKKLSDEKALQYAGMGGVLFLSKDLYAKGSKSQMAIKIDTGLGKNADKFISDFGASVISTLSDETGVHSDDLFRVAFELDVNRALNDNAYAINTFAQTLLLDWIWDDSSSNSQHPEL